jgi:hypothetical protein
MSSTQDLHPSKDTKEKKNLNSQNTTLPHRRGNTKQEREGKKYLETSLIIETFL